MSLKQKVLVAILLIITIVAGIYLLINYELIHIIDPVANDTDDINITHIVPHSLEKYKILNIQYNNNKIYAIVALDNGNIRIIEFNDAYIDPNLKNINDGFLYRDSMQIYIKSK